MSSKNIYLYCLSAMLALALVGCSSIGRLSRSDDEVRDSILKCTPLGSSRENVKAFIKQHHWAVSKDFTPGQTPDPGRIGGTMEERNLGSTLFANFPFETDVIAYWVFDKNNHLVDVCVIHDTDAL
jgi:hypothetical protein